DAEGYSSQEALRPGVVDVARPAQRHVSRKIGPGAHHRLALGNPLEAALDDGFCGQLATFDQSNQGRGRKAIWVDIRHCASPRRRRAHLAMSGRNTSPEIAKERAPQPIHTLADDMLDPCEQSLTRV